MIIICARGEEASGLYSNKDNRCASLFDTLQLHQYEHAAEYEHNDTHDEQHGLLHGVTHEL